MKRRMPEPEIGGRDRGIVGEEKKGRIKKKKVERVLESLIRLCI